MKFQSLIEIKIEGLNQEKFFNKLNNLGVEIFDFKRLSYSISIFKILTKDIKIVKKNLDSNNFKIIYIKKIGLNKFINKIISSVGIVLGLLIFLAFLFISNNFILRIDIIGNQNISSNTILEFLNNNKIGCFSSKNSINNENLEKILLANFNEISMVSVIEKGSTLIINIKEKIETANSDSLDNNKYKNIVAEYNGRIKNIELISGTLNVKPGSLFKKGDVLVFAYYYDSLNNKKCIEASAKINAEIWIETQYTHYENQIEKYYTGNEITIKNISLCGVNLFNQEKDIIYKNYETTQTQTKLKNVLLPITISTITYKEIKTKKITKMFQDYKEDILKKCQENTLQKLLKNDIILSENYNIINQTNDIINIQYVITVERVL